MGVAERVEDQERCGRGAPTTHGEVKKTAGRSTVSTQRGRTRGRPAWTAAWTAWRAWSLDIGA